MFARAADAIIDSAASHDMAAAASSVGGTWLPLKPLYDHKRPLAQCAPALLVNVGCRTSSFGPGPDQPYCSCCLHVIVRQEPSTCSTSQRRPCSCCSKSSELGCFSTLPLILAGGSHLIVHTQRMIVSCPSQAVAIWQGSEGKGCACLT